MAAHPGEENVATLFGDIHYFYGPPTANPPHHRFDKGSYVYLFENAANRRARIEIANHPGTDDQDAFEGYLDATHVQYSYRHSCMVSIIVGETQGNVEWHLPTFDPRNENKYHYKLHSLDIYFWTPNDAVQFVNGVRRVLPPHQVHVMDEPAPPPQPEAHPTEMSAVVKKLENAAISQPAAAASGAQAPGLPSYAPPPISAVSGDGEQGANYAPIAYNPAAPPAPESISHREKTPPPADGGINPLHAAVAYDAQQPFSPGFAPPGAVTSPGFPPPSQYSGPPQPGSLQRATTMPAHGLASPGLASPYGSAFPGQPGKPQQQAQAAQATAPATNPPVTSPGLPPPPPGGYAQYSYSSKEAGPAATDYSIHQQLYRPTEDEMATKYAPKKEPRGRLEENAGRLERGVTGMLKKFEKKFG